MSLGGRVAWFFSGAFTVLVALGFFVAWQFDAFGTWKPSPDWDSVGPIAISPKWSVTLEERGSHPFLAEYEYRIRVFTHEEREGEYRGTVELLPNSGGRTYLCLFTLTLPDRAPLLEVVDRIDTSIVDLQLLRRLTEAPKGFERLFLGAFVESAQPLRFVSAEVQPTCPSDR